MKSTQRGLSLIGLLVVGGMLAFLGVVAAQAVPVLLEYQAIIKASKKAAQETTVATVRAAFDRAQAIDDFSSVAGKDLEITKEADKVVVSFAYEREIPLGGPVYLTFKLKGNSK